MLNELSAMPWRHMGEWRYSSTFLDLGTRWRWSASRPGRFTAGEGAPGTHWIGSWVGPLSGSGRRGEKSSISGNRTQAVQPDWAITVRVCKENPWWPNFLCQPDKIGQKPISWLSDIHASIIHKHTFQNMREIQCCRTNRICWSVTFRCTLNRKLQPSAQPIHKYSYDSSVIKIASVWIM
jgi:hypothetical protein